MDYQLFAVGRTETRLGVNAAGIGSSSTTPFVPPADLRRADAGWWSLLDALCAAMSWVPHYRLPPPHLWNAPASCLGAVTDEEGGSPSRPAGRRLVDSIGHRCKGFAPPRCAPPLGGGRRTGGPPHRPGNWPSGRQASICKRAANSIRRGPSVQAPSRSNSKHLTYLHRLPRRRARSGPYSANARALDGRWATLNGRDRAGLDADPYIQRSLRRTRFRLLPQPGSEWSPRW